jgi:hypothetical protein
MEYSARLDSRRDPRVARTTQLETQKATELWPKVYFRLRRLPIICPAIFGPSPFADFSALANKKPSGKQTKTATGAAPVAGGSGSGVNFFAQNCWETKNETGMPSTNGWHAWVENRNLLRY